MICDTLYLLLYGDKEDAIEIYEQLIKFDYLFCYNKVYEIFTWH